MRRYVFLAVLLLVLPVAPAAWAGPEDEIRTLFDRFVAAQNAHDLSAVRGLLGTPRAFSGSRAGARSGVVRPG